MKIRSHNRNVRSALIALGLGLASSGALADADAIKVTQMPDQAVPGAHTIVDARGAIVIENTQRDEAGKTVAENAVGGRVGRLELPEGSK